MPSITWDLNELPFWPLMALIGKSIDVYQSRACYEPLINLNAERNSARV